VVGGGDELYSCTLRAKRVNWIALDDLRGRCECRRRFAIVTNCRGGREKTGDSEVLLTFDEPQRAITPGRQ